MTGSRYPIFLPALYVADVGNHRIQKFAPVLWFDVAGYDSYLSVTTMHETTAVGTLFQLENNGAPRFGLRNMKSDIEWSFQELEAPQYRRAKSEEGICAITYHLPSFRKEVMDDR